MPEVTVRQHHALVRIAHWLMLPLLVGLIMSGLSVYWAAPVYPPGFPKSFYDLFSFGRQALAVGLLLHWFFAYLFMVCGLLYLVGLIAGGGWLALTPRRGDFREALAMIRYYLGLIPMRLRRRPWPHPQIDAKYNALQRAAYASIPFFGLIVVASGWAMHKPVQFWWLERLFGSYDGARIIHFWTMWFFVAFAVPHVILVIADGWATMRSMITGWSTRTSHDRRDFVLFGVGVVAAFAGFRMIRKGRLPRTVLAFDDYVAEALYSPTRSVRTYSRKDVTPLKNNYEGKTPGPEYLANWTLTLSGLASGHDVQLTVADLLRFAHHEQVTRLVCVEGWSAIAWWGGLRFDELLRAYPPMEGARWAALESAVNLDWRGGSDPYYVSIDLPTARHAQTLLATHNNGAPLTLAHGAPLRLVVPMKLGLKNIKAITRIAYTREEPRDYWGERGYSRYDGL
jgi:DMSO/TMAO reductase YedYZ molybdopterin-dependent catalytic subunit/thiosulfate reductase cytochrome b subunit